MEKVIDLFSKEQQKQERILHAVKRLANAVDELLKEVLREYQDESCKSCGD